MSAQNSQRPRPRQRLVPIALLAPMAALWLASAPPAAAFSQIGSQDGSDRQKTGIISVPLPPLPGAVEPARAETPAAPATTSPAAKPATAAPTAPTATTPSTGATSAPAGPAPATAAPAPADTGTTDQSEVDAPATDDAPAATDDDSGEGDDSADTPATTPGDDAAPDAGDDSAPDGDAPKAEADTPPAQVYYGEDGLPQAVRDLRSKLIEICRAGDIEALRPYLQTGEDATVITFGDAEGDPITALKAASGDGQGVEMLAILLEVLQAGHVRSEPDTDAEIFVWPYFTGVPIDKLTNPQKVELFELVTAGDYQEMLGFGAYNFYRVGISPDGKLQFFVAGD